MTKEMDADLFCLHCSIDTIHKVTYKGNYLKSIKCNECGSELEIRKDRLLEFFAADFIERIMTKPKRMTAELEKDLTKFIMSLPIRIITKPYRVVKEVQDILEK
jgi:transcription elongation factor Elf1